MYGFESLFLRFEPASDVFLEVFKLFLHGVVLLLCAESQTLLLFEPFRELRDPLGFVGHLQGYVCNFLGKLLVQLLEAASKLGSSLTFHVAENPGLHELDNC